MSEAQMDKERTIADVQVGERVAVRYNGWQRWGTVRRLTATQIITDGPNDVLTEERWRRVDGRAYEKGSGYFHWEIGIPTALDEAAAELGTAIRYISMARAVLGTLQVHEYARKGADVHAAVLEATRGCRALTKILAEQKGTTP